MKGKTNNPNGRPTGTPNKITTELRQQINNFLSDNWQSIQSDFKALEPRDRLAFYEKMLSYGLPKPAPEKAEPQGQDVISLFEMMFDKMDNKPKRIARAK